MSNTPRKAPPIKAGWTDTEKLLLLVSLVEGHGGPNWKNTALPQGRNLPSCQGIWHRLKTEAQKSVGEDEFDGSTKATSKSAAKRKKGAETGTKGMDGMAVKKRGRKGKAVDAANATDAADDDKVTVKAELDA